MQQDISCTSSVGTGSFITFSISLALIKEVSLTTEPIYKSFNCGQERIICEAIAEQMLGAQNQNQILSLIGQ